MATRRQKDLVCIHDHHDDHDGHDGHDGQDYHHGHGGYGDRHNGNQPHLMMIPLYHLVGNPELGNFWFNIIVLLRVGRNPVVGSLVNRISQLAQMSMAETFLT